MNRFSIHEIASMLGCTIYPIRKAINTGALRAEKVGTAYLVPADALYEWILGRERYGFSLTPEERKDIQELLNELPDYHPAKRALIRALAPVTARPKKPGDQLAALRSTY